jgi:hypothetical protein
MQSSINRKNARFMRKERREAGLCFSGLAGKQGEVKRVTLEELFM